MKHILTALLVAAALTCCTEHPNNVVKSDSLPRIQPGYEVYGKMLDSFNTPDFTSRPVEMDNRAAGMGIMSDQRTETIVRK